MVQSMRGVLMKTRTKLSYVILKYDDQTDSIFTKTANNENHVYEVPSIDFKQKETDNLDDIKEFILENVTDFNPYINEKHVFIPFINVKIENGIKDINYVAVIFESNQTAFSSMNYESWHRVKFNQKNQVWKLAWGSGLTDPVDFKFKNRVTNQFEINPSDNDEINFNNIMYFVTEQMNDFPILGLMSGDKFTMRQVQHYQDILQIDTLKAASNKTFKNQYSDSIQEIDDNRITTSYKFKNEYLKK